MKQLRLILQLLCVMTIPPPAFSQPLSSLNDEFTDKSSMSRWKSFHESEGWPSHVLKVGINNP